MLELSGSKSPMTLIAIASACGQFTKIGNFVSTVDQYLCHQGFRFILAGRMDSGWEFSLIIWPSGRDGRIFNFNPPVFEQLARVRFSQRLIPPGAHIAEWTGMELWAEYSLATGITVRKDLVEEIRIICPEKSRLLMYANSPSGDKGAAEFAAVRNHLPTCDTCRQLVDTIEADPSSQHLKP